MTRPVIPIDPDAVWCGPVELAAEPPAPWTPTTRDGHGYGQGRALVRLHGRPIEHAPFDLPGGVLDEAPLRARYEARLAATPKPDDPAEPATASVSVVVCTRNRAHALEPCLDSLRALPHRPLEIVLVDNAPSDGSTRRAFQRLAGDDERFRYVREDAPGLSRARNAGVAAAAGEIVAFTDDDVEVEPDWISGLLSGFAMRTDVGCVTGFIAPRSLDTLAARYFDARVSWSTSFEPRVYDTSPGGGHTDSAIHPFSAGRFGAGANFAVRADVLKAVGPFDEALGAGTATAGGEDLDMFLRVLLAGHALAYEPAALVWHSHRDDLQGLYRQMFGYGSGLTAYLSKHAVAPETRRELWRRAGAGLKHLTTLHDRTRGGGEQPPADADRSVRPTAPLPADVARRMRLREFAGMAAGPALYARALREVRKR